MTKYCLNCSDRRLYCHDKCEKYAMMKQEREQINKKHRQYLDGLGYDGCLSPKSGRMKRYAFSRF